MFWSNIKNEQFNNEASVETRLVLPLLHALGYDDCDISAKHPLIFQQGTKGRNPEADFVIFYGSTHNRDTSMLVVEAKAPGASFDNAKSQGESYAFNIRAPFLLLTDGIKLEIWQLQPTLESELLVNIDISSILSVQGKIESLLGKESAYAYCKTLSQKSALFVSSDLGPYEIAEFNRTASSSKTIDRTLDKSDTGGNEKIHSSQLLSSMRKGAIILAPSGYGKTTLSVTLFHQAIEDRSNCHNCQLALEVPLPDLSETGLNILEFMRQRIAAHLPSYPEARLKELLRVEGAILLCDAFDRLSMQDHRKLEADLKNLNRDFPLLRIFIFSRASSMPTLPLPVLVLEQLDFKQQRSFVDSMLQRKSGSISPLFLMPELLRNLCFHPLLMSLAIDYWQKKEKWPSKIEELFRSWLDLLLLSDPRSGAENIDLEAALTLLAKATSNSLIRKDKALSLLREHEFDVTIFNKLLSCDAIRFKSASIELQHESLADYLRALDLTSKCENEIAQILLEISLEADSLFPILLMALLPSNSLQRCLWHRLANLSFPVYLNSLRYRANVTEKMKMVSKEGLGFQYLQDLVEGIEFPINGFFPQLSDRIKEQFFIPEDAEFGITGIVDSEAEDLVFCFRPLITKTDEKILISSPDRNYTQHFVNLKLSEYRLDSGRLLGANFLKKSLLEIVKFRKLKGGVIWTNERVLGHLRYLAQAHSFPIENFDSFEKIEKLLRPKEKMNVFPGWFRNAPTFTMKNLLDDIAFLQSHGQMSLDSWWIQLGGNNSSEKVCDDSIRILLNEHFRRLQMVYAEIVENSFQSIANSFSFYSAMPVRWDLAIVQCNEALDQEKTMFTRWSPVSSWKSAGADCEFAASPPDRFRDHDFSKLKSELERLGRPVNTNLSLGGFQPLPNFDCNFYGGGIFGETTVMSAVCELITRDINKLFSELPERDST